MKTTWLSTTQPGKFVRSSTVNKASILILVLGLAYFICWLVNYSRIIITTPYPSEYREGAIVLLTASLIRGVNPGSLANHPLMTNNYGFLYNLVVLPFAIGFGNTLAIHRIVSIFFLLASCTLIFFTLDKIGLTWPFSLASSGILMASLLFGVTPLARPDTLGEFLFLLAILLPWYRKFDITSLLISCVTTVLAFLAKPYFILSMGIVSMFTFLFISKRKGVIYASLTIGLLILVLFIVNIFYECYYLDIMLNNVANIGFNNIYMQRQLTVFIKVFCPSIIILLLNAGGKEENVVRKTGASSEQKRFANLYDLERPLISSSANYFVFFLGCASIVVLLVLGKHVGAYMIYFFQLIAPALVLAAFQHRDFLDKNAVIAVPLIFVNLSLLCFWVLYPNKLTASQSMAWEKLYQYVGRSSYILNSPILVPEMVRLEKIPVDSGQTEYFFSTEPYSSTRLAPEYYEVVQQRTKYIELIKLNIENQYYDYIILASPQPALGLPPFINYQSIDQYYDQVELIDITMPQTRQHFAIEIHKPQE